MLPPPTTTAVWMPRSTTSASCRATSAVASALMPEPVPPGRRPRRRASAGPGGSGSVWCSVIGHPRDSSVVGLVPRDLGARRSAYCFVLAQLVPDEPADGNLLTHLGRGLVEAAAARSSRRPSRTAGRAGRCPCRRRSSLPSTIFSITVSGLPDSCACSAKICRSRSSSSGGTSSRVSEPRRCGARDVQGDVLGQLAGTRRCWPRSRSRS